MTNNSNAIEFPKHLKTFNVSDNVLRTSLVALLAELVNLVCVSDAQGQAVLNVRDSPEISFDQTNNQRTTNTNE